MVDIEDVDRGRGIFAEVDRMYLTDPENYGNTRQARYKRRQDIPKRIRNAFLDISILADPGFNDDFLEQAFRDESGDTQTVGEIVAAWRDRDPEVKEKTPLDEQIEESFVDAVALIHRVTTADIFNEIIEGGVKRAVEWYYPEYECIDASYNPQIERAEDAYDRAKWKLSNGMKLTDEEVRILLEDGEVDPEQVAENVREHSSDSEEEEDQTLTDAISSPQDLRDD